MKDKKKYTLKHAVNVLAASQGITFLKYFDILQTDSLYFQSFVFQRLLVKQLKYIISERSDLTKVSGHHQCSSIYKLYSS